MLKFTIYFLIPFDAYLTLVLHCIQLEMNFTATEKRIITFRFLNGTQTCTHTHTFTGNIRKRPLDSTSDFTAANRAFLSTFRDLYSTNSSDELSSDHVLFLECMKIYFLHSRRLDTACQVKTKIIRTINTGTCKTFRFSNTDQGVV